MSILNESWVNAGAFVCSSFPILRFSDRHGGLSLHLFLYGIASGTRLKN